MNHVNVVNVLHDLKTNYINDIPQIESVEDQEECTKLCREVALILSKIDDIEEENHEVEKLRREVQAEAKQELELHPDDADAKWIAQALRATKKEAEE